MSSVTKERDTEGICHDSYKTAFSSADHPSGSAVGRMGNMHCGLGAALCHGPRGCKGPHAIGPASSQCTTRRRTRGLGGDGGYISRGPTPKAHSSPGNALPIIYLIAG